MRVAYDSEPPLQVVGGDAGTQERNWRESAVCRQTDPEVFFPEKGGSTREAKRICAGCEFREVCLEEALTRREQFGIWGGMSWSERKVILRARV